MRIFRVCPLFIEVLLSFCPFCILSKYFISFFSNCPVFNFILWILTLPNSFTMISDVSRDERNLVLFLSFRKESRWDLNKSTTFFRTVKLNVYHLRFFTIQETFLVYSPFVDIIIKLKLKLRFNYRKINKGIFMLLLWNNNVIYTPLPSVLELVVLTLFYRKLKFKLSPSLLLVIHNK